MVVVCYYISEPDKKVHCDEYSRVVEHFDSVAEPGARLRWSLFDFINGGGELTE